MSGKGKFVHDAQVNINFEETLTRTSCSKIVIEIIKYLTYQKQQIPYPFEQLKHLVNKRKADEGTMVNKSLKGERYHFKASEAVEILENIFQNIEAEFMISSQAGCGGVEEVAILFGATPVTPKDVFRIRIPDLRNEFETPKPPSRRMLVQLLRCIIESESLHSMVSKPVTTTNTFIFLKRKLNHSQSASDNFVNKSWFLPRENFKLPQKGRQAVLRIEYTPPKQLVELEAESPLARPLVSVSDSESTPVKDDCSRDKLCSPLKKVENLKQLGQCDNAKVTKIPGFKLPNHLVFKAPIPARERPENSIHENSCEIKCLESSISSSVNWLSGDFKTLSFNPCTEKSTSYFNSIQWFEARAPIRGFKDCVVNGVSAITL